jgi:hypothetical protein
MEVERIAVLEQKLRKLQVTVLGLVGLIVTVGVLATISPANARFQVTDLVQTRELQIVDEDGTILAKITNDTHGGLFQMYNKSNATVFNALVDEGGLPILDIGTPGYRGKLRLINTPGHNTVELGIRDNDTGYLQLKDANGLDAIWINSEGNGGLVRWNNKKGEMAGFLGTNENGGIVGVHGNDEEGTSPRLFAGSNLFNGTGVVEVIGSNGNTTFLTGTFGDTPYLSLKNQTGQTVISGTATQNGALTIRNAEGMNIVRADADSVANGQLAVNNAAGETRVRATVQSARGNGALKITNADGSLMVNVDTVPSELNTAGSPIIGLRNTEGVRAARLFSFPGGAFFAGYNGEGDEKFRHAITSAGHGYTLLKRADGVTTHFVGSSSDGRPTIDLKNPAGGSLYIAEEDSVTGIGSLKTYGPDGSPLWRSGQDSTGAGGSVETRLPVVATQHQACWAIWTTTEMSTSMTSSHLPATLARVLQDSFNKRGIYPGSAISVALPGSFASQIGS